MKKIQVLLGIILAVITLVLGFIVLDNEGLFFRLIIGLVLGYALVRGSFGFAGSVNRAYRAGSTKLVRTLMFLFTITAIGTAVLLYSGAITNENFWVKPINLGLLAGALLFGIGMALASCCASGVLTDLSSGAIRALIAIFFFGIGVFVGLPIAKGGYDWIEKSWFSTSSFDGKGVYLPDWFSGGPFNGYLGAVAVVIVLALAVSYLAKYVEERIKAKGNYKGVAAEVAYKKNEQDELPLNPVSKSTYDYILGNPWSLRTTAIVISSAFLALLAITKVGWGISTIYGLWFGKLLTLFGVSETWIAEFTNMGAASFTGVFEHPVSVQNIAIILGGLIAGLTMGKFKAKLKITGKEVAVFAFGGLLLGFGTRLSQGCNVGALYTPIANFSLSGWFFLVFMVLGGILGNYILKKLLK